MKHKFQSILCVLAFCLAAAAQQNPPAAPQQQTSRLGFPVFSLNAVPISGATIQLVGQPGQATWYLWAVANYQEGSVMSPIGVVTNAPNTLSAQNYIAIYPQYPTTAGVTVDILATQTALQPSGACGCAVATGATSGVVNFQSNTTSAYTVTLLAANSLRVWLTNEITGTGVSHLLLRDELGNLITDLSAGGLTCPGCSSNTLVLYNGTTLANSPVTSNGTKISFGSGLAPLSAGNSVLGTFNLATSGSCAGTTGIPLVPPAGIACTGVLVFNQPGPSGASSTFSNFSSVIQPTSATQGALWMAGYFAFNYSGTGGGTTASEERTLYVENTGLGSTPTTRRGIYVYDANARTNGTITTQEGIVIDNQQLGTGNTITNDYGLHVLSPTITAGTMTHHAGIRIEDQTATAGGTNPDPYSIWQLGNGKNVFQGHLDQNATGNWAGTCAMAAGTTCTITITAAYTSTPGCIATVQGVTAIAAACGVSGTTITITAASANSQTWAAMLFGNPT